MNFSFFSIIDFSVLILCHPGAQIHNSHHSDTYDVGAARVVVFGVPLWLDVKPPRVILQVRARNLACLFSFGVCVFFARPIISLLQKRKFLVILFDKIIRPLMHRGKVCPHLYFSRTIVLGTAGLSKDNRDMW